MEPTKPPGYGALLPVIWALVKGFKLCPIKKETILQITRGPYYGNLNLKP